MTESQEELFEPSQINEDELIDQLLNEEDDTQNDDETEETQTEAEKPGLSKSTSFPLSRIKALMKLDPDVGLLSSESIFLVSKATELFLKSLSKETFNFTAKSKRKRKTVQKRDVEAAIENIDALYFLEGAMDN